MLINNIDVVVPNVLYSVHFVGEQRDELTRLLRLWQNNEYLRSFFKDPKNAQLLSHYNFKAPEYTKYDHVKATMRVVKDASEMQDRLHEVCDGVTPQITSENIGSIFDFFHHNEKAKKLPYVELKFRHASINSWPRIYALQRIKADDSCVYIICSGALKIVRSTSEHPDTQQAVNKMKFVHQHLKAKGIIL